MNALQNLAPREKALIGIAAVLLVLMVLWQFILKPILGMSANADIKQNAALRDYQIVGQAAPFLAASAPTQTGRQAFDRMALIQVAGQNGVTISRLQPAPNESLQVWFEVNSPSEILTMLDQVQSAYAAEITRVQMNRRENNIVSAQVTFTPTSGAVTP